MSVTYQDIGFDSQLFEGELLIDPPTQRIFIVTLISKQPGQGNFSRFLERITAAGYTPAIVSPFPKMKAILERKGYKPHSEFFAPANMVVTIWQA